jgi:uncharacterized membrane protein HdeD (DUF308 family)
VSRLLPLVVIALSTITSLALSVRIGALLLAAGLALLAAQVYLQRVTRSPWRSQSSDLTALLALAAGVALLAFLLP